MKTQTKIPKKRKERFTLCLVLQRSKKSRLFDKLMQNGEIDILS